MDGRSRPGTKVLIGAERDGDTISPERGVYLVDLTRKVTKEDLLARIQSCREAETALRAKGERMFAPIRDAVRAAVDRISITKIFDHEAALFDFDTKYIGTPGNAKAIDYIAAQLKSFGYEPEIQAFETRGTKMANVLATLRGTADPGNHLRPERALRLEPAQPRCGRQHVGDGRQPRDRPACSPALPSPPP